MKDWTDPKTALNVLKVAYITQQDDIAVEYAVNQFKKLLQLVEKWNFMAEYYKWLQICAKQCQPLISMLNTLRSMVEEEKSKINIPTITPVSNWTITQKPYCDIFFCLECPKLKEFLLDPNKQVWRYKVKTILLYRKAHIFKGGGAKKLAHMRQSIHYGEIPAKCENYSSTTISVIKQSPQEKEKEVALKKIENLDKVLEQINHVLKTVSSTPSVAVSGVSMEEMRDVKRQKINC